MTDEEIGRRWARCYGVEPRLAQWGWDWLPAGGSGKWGLPGTVRVNGCNTYTEAEIYAALGRAVRELADTLRAIPSGLLPFAYPPRPISTEGAYRG